VSKNCNIETVTFFKV